jgi:hypothetical protein
LRVLGADDVCIRTPAYYESYEPAYHAELVARAIDAGMTISLWPVVSLYAPEAQADAVLEEIDLYKPEFVTLDAERKWVTKYIANIERFLNRLGKPGVPVGLASYRRANLHPDMRWQVWLRHKTAGKFTLDFLGHQLYPVGWNAPAAYAEQTRLDVLSHDAEVQKAGREPMPWRPFLPAFAEHGWTPSGEGVTRQYGSLNALLGSRLQGVVWWSLDQNVVDPGLESVYEAIKSM